MHGISDRPLSPFGLQQAELTGKALKDTKATRMFVSPLLRTKQTAMPIERTTGLKSEYLDNLVERDYGWREGKRSHWNQIRKSKFLRDANLFVQKLVALFSGEKFEEFRQRVKQGWDHIRSQAKDGEELIIVAHAGVIRTILMEEFGNEHINSNKFFISTCSISEIEIYSDQPSKIIEINRVDHLDGKVRP
jgi:broad specificity phosphatase PhoE